MSVVLMKTGRTAVLMICLGSYVSLGAKNTLPPALAARAARPQLRLFQNVEAPFKHEKVVADQSLLASAAKDALLYFNRSNAKTSSKLFAAHLLTTADVKRTLEFIVRTAEEDARTGKKRLNDTGFITRNFRCVQWSGDLGAARRNKVEIPQWPDGGVLKPGKIKLTSYASFRLQGNYKKNDEYCCALYGLKPHVDVKSFCPRFTKQDSVAGVLDRKEFKESVHPLVWLTREGMEEAMLQGCAIVHLPDGKQRLYNVFKSNNISHDKSIKDFHEQRRFWFFKEVNCAYGDDGKEHLRIIHYPGVVFAGDIYSLGLGKIIALKYQNPITKENQLRLGVLLDTGGAFKDNLYQLDLYAGIFDNRDDFKAYISHMPNTTQAYILVKKS